MTNTHSSSENAEALLDLQRRADIPHLPTQMTYEARLAVSNEGPRAYDWQDKPHRLVYDLCREIERLSIPAQQMPDGLANLRAIVADQPFQNSGLSVHEINLILANDGGFMPDEAVMWFRSSRGTLGISASSSPECGNTPEGK